MQDQNFIIKIVVLGYFDVLFPSFAVAMIVGVIISKTFLPRKEVVAIINKIDAMRQ